MVEPEARFQELVNRLREQEYRLTPQRIALLRPLAASDGHPSASQLYDQLRALFPTTSLAAIYSTAHLLKNLDELLELSFSNDDNRDDGNKPCPNPHVTGVRCQRSIDREIGIAEDLVHQLALQSGYQIVSHWLDFYGVRPECREDE